MFDSIFELIKHVICITPEIHTYTLALVRSTQTKCSLERAMPQRYHPFSVFVPDPVKYPSPLVICLNNTNLRVDYWEISSKIDLFRFYTDFQSEAQSVGPLSQPDWAQTGHWQLLDTESQRQDSEGSAWSLNCCNYTLLLHSECLSLEDL